MKNKKKMLCILCIYIMAFIVGVILARVLPVLWIASVSKWKYNAEYEGYSTQFDMVRDYVAEKYPDEDDKYISVSYDKQEKKPYFYDYDSSERLECSEDIISALSIIREEGFPSDATFDGMHVHGKSIAFCISNGNYELVYSPHEEATWIGPSEDEDEISVKEIDDGWYHVVKR